MCKTREQHPNDDGNQNQSHTQRRSSLPTLGNLRTSSSPWVLLAIDPPGSRFNRFKQISINAGGCYSLCGNPCLRTTRVCCNLAEMLKYMTFSTFPRRSKPHHTPGWRFRMTRCSLALQQQYDALTLFGRETITPSFSQEAYPLWDPPPGRRYRGRWRKLSCST